MPIFLFIVIVIVNYPTLYKTNVFSPYCLYEQQLTKKISIQEITTITWIMEINRQRLLLGD